jgi:hypothetical protein
MFDTIVSNVLVPAAFVALFIVVPLWRVLRPRGHGARRPPDAPEQRMMAAAMLNGFGPFWYAGGLGRHLDAASAERRAPGGDTR